MAEATPNTYDEVSYPSYPFAQSHPDRLATLATLFGMKPARIESRRVLEIGCGDGANLIPMAHDSAVSVDSISPKFCADGFITGFPKWRYATSSS
ncbi:MAG TPA: hypothetical protein VJZ26_05780 [Blastocatellia bacterium]|nr:hypothetical protein [Blastocatellia bacterium]